MSAIRRFKVIIAVLAVICIAASAYGYHTYSNYQELLYGYNTLREYYTQSQHRQELLEDEVGELLAEIAALETELVKWKPTQGKAWFQDSTYVSKGNGSPITLIDYPTASNPTWEQLLSFLAKDTTDEKPYSNVYVCADFAEELHNNAEKAGIKAAYIVLDFNVGDSHAINAFQTLDKGLVYVDCTGDDPTIIKCTGITDPDTGVITIYSPRPSSWDTIAYVEDGKEYGLIDLDYAEQPYYWFWEEYIARWDRYNVALEQYNLEVEQYNREISGKVYIIGTPEWEWIKQWEAKLEEKERVINKLREGLPNWYYPPQEIVTEITIIWAGT